MWIVITEELIESAVLNNSPSQKAARLLGLGWPLKPGWRRRATGQTYDVDPRELADEQNRVAERRGRGAAPRLVTSPAAAGLRVEFDAADQMLVVTDVRGGKVTRIPATVLRAA